MRYQINALYSRRLVALTFLCVPLIAHTADFSGLAGPSQSGENLLALIKRTDSTTVKPDDLVSFGTAAGYVQSVRDYNAYNRWNMIAVLKKQPVEDVDKVKPAIAEMFFCEPPTMSNGQVLAITRKFLEQTPERWNENAFNLVQSAFKAAYPCKVEDLFR